MKLIKAEEAVILVMISTIMTTKIIKKHKN
jgi:hypothetical protein